MLVPGLLARATPRGGALRFAWVRFACGGPVGGVRSVAHATPAQAQPEQPTTHFDTIQSSVCPPLFQALTRWPYHLEAMTPVQEQVLALLPDLVRARTVPEADGEQGRDLLVKATPGMGKTVAYLTAAIEARVQRLERIAQGEEPDVLCRIRERHPDSAAGRQKGDAAQVQNTPAFLYASHTVGTLILTPTRELALKVAGEAQRLQTYVKHARVQVLLAGESRREQLKQWRKGRLDMVIATPDRLWDLLREEDVRQALAACGTLVLDEADMLLELGFRDDLQRILQYLPPPSERCTMMFSATSNGGIPELAKRTLHPKHRFIDCVGEDDGTHKHISQSVTVLRRAKYLWPHLLRLIVRDQLMHQERSKVIVFAATNALAMMLTDALHVYRDQLPAKDTLILETHSAKARGPRGITSARFRAVAHRPSILVSSDVTARGVHFPDVTEVIQFGMPATRQMYLHRVGRTGRRGNPGRSDLVLMSWESPFLTFELEDIPYSLLSEKDVALDAQRRARSSDAELGRALHGAESNEDAERTRRTVWRDAEPIAPRYTDEALKEKISATRAHMDPELSRQVFTSLLGFYMAHADVLRTTKGAIMQAVQDWVINMTQLVDRPHIPEHLMRELGVTPGEFFYREEPGRFQGRIQRRVQHGFVQEDERRLAQGLPPRRRTLREAKASKKRYRTRKGGSR